MIQIVVIAVVTIIASCFAFLAGFGMSTLMIPILLLFLPDPLAVIFLVGILHWFHDIWMVWFFGHGINWRLFLHFGITGTITSFLGALIVGGGFALLPALLGLFLVSYVLFLFIMPTFKLKYNLLIGLVGGSVSGFFAGIFGMRGPVRSLFLSAFDLPKATYISTTGLIGLLIDTTRLVTYWYGGIQLGQTLTWGLLVFIPASFIGAHIGSYLVGKIPQEYFRKIIAFFLLLIGIRLLLMSLFA